MMMMIILIIILLIIKTTATIQRGDLPVLSILYLIQFVRIDCSWALHIKTSLHPFISLFLIYLHVLFLSLSPISPANCPCILFAIHSFFLCSLLVFLNSLGSILQAFFIVLLVLTATCNGSILFFDVPTQTIFFTLHTIFTSNKSSFTISQKHTTVQHHFLGVIFYSLS